MSQKRPPEQQALFKDLPRGVRGEAGKVIKPLRYPVWTEKKALLIERYLYYFVLITKHGTYVDGFAGPQDSKNPETWAARLVLESVPRWLRQFHLFEKDPAQAALLEQLRDRQPPRKRGEPKREIHVYQGDFNDRIAELLSTRALRESEATFCLLDQRTFECRWSTLEALAAYKQSGHKIELFYFLPIAWLDRALAAQKDAEVVEAWWGRPDWRSLRELPRDERARTFSARFRDLGYRSVKPWPIYESPTSGRTMYYMIHCTDHEEAPQLMARAYSKVVEPKESHQQLSLDLAWEP